ncbi:MAG: fimbrillin family protein, partial [Bacteroidales bacterium]|nr:fimbrillin family protein [Bacteroidales bacterium]
MKQIRKFTLGRFLSAVLGLFFLFGGVACTRDDASNLQVSKGPQPIKFQVANTSALTKSGDSSPIVEQLTSTFFDVVDGDSLYLSLESTPWEVDVAATKVTPYDDTDEGLNRLTSSSLGLIAYKANNATVGQGGWTYYAGPSEFKYKGTFWEPDVPVIWPNLNKFIRFFAYAPYNDALTMTVDNPHTGKEPTLEGFQVSDNYNTHTDLLIASEVTADSNPLILNGGGAMESYKLTFKHALTAIRFKVLKSANITVNAVRVRGVYDGGILNLHRGWWRGADLTKSGQTISISGAIETIDDGFYQHFAPKYTLMMIPNVSGWASVYTPFEDGAEIEINYTKNETGESKTIITDISKHQWRAGYALTYVIGDYQPSSDQYDYFFSVLTQPTMDYSGKLSDNGRISSYRYPKGIDDTNESLREEVSWTIEGYYTSLAAAR